MKLGIVVASENALPTAFAVLRGIAGGIECAARLGYDGIELAVRDGREFSYEQITKMAAPAGVEISAISTGQLFADKHLWLSARDNGVREAAADAFIDIIDMASGFGCFVNIGRARGFVEDGDDEASTAARFADSLALVAAHAEKRGITLVIEPVNRYETNYINSVGEGAALIDSLERSGIHGLKLMPDFFHMNIEDASMEDSLLRNKNRIGYIHVADSNRLAPGRGHINFGSLFDALAKIGYDGWLTLESLPKPSPEEAAKQAIDYLRRRYPA